MRIAHNGQQCVQGERDVRRHRADASRQRNQDGEEGERGNRLHHAGRADNNAFRRRTLRRENPEWYADDDAGCERKEDESQLFERQASEVGTKELAPEIVEPARLCRRTGARGYARLPG